MSVPAIITSPSYVIRNQILARLGDQDAGFTPTYATVVATGQYPLAPSAMVFDFASLASGRRSANVFEARMKVETLVSGGIVKFPLIQIYAKAGRNTNMQKFRGFAGPVAVSIDVLLGSGPYNSSHTLSDYEDWPDAVESTMLSLIQPAVRQSWDPTTVYNGDLGWQRSDVVQGGESWLQAVQFSLTFDVIL